MRLTNGNYNELGYAYIENFLTKEETEHLTQVMLNAKKANALTLETDIRFYNKSEGGAPNEFREILHKKTPLIKELLSMPDIAAESVYSRIYYDKSTMNPHFDRNKLDHTLSVNLFSNLAEPWPLYCVDKKCDIVSFDIKPGDGAIMLGTQLVHWRKPLACTSEQFVIQSFFHWRNV
jgi:hypothetical protein